MAEPRHGAERGVYRPETPCGVWVTGGIAVGILGAALVAAGTGGIAAAVNGVGQSITQNFTVQVFQHGFRLSGTMIHPVAFHTATPLTTGQVLIAGGYDEWPASGQTPGGVVFPPARPASRGSG